jgi:hypothetical protein
LKLIQQAVIAFAPGREPHPLERRDPGDQADREGRQDNMESHREGELDARQESCVIKHGSRYPERFRLNALRDVRE